MGRLFPILLLCVSFLCAVLRVVTIGLPSVSADTIYTYTGNPFTTFSGADSCSMGFGDCRISGAITFATPLGNNLPFQEVGPISASFTDGKTTITAPPETLANLEVATGTTGLITEWAIAIHNAEGLEIDTTNWAGGIGDLTSVDQMGKGPRTFALVSNDPGIWTISQTAAPESSSLLLLGTGLLVVVGFNPKRFKAHI
jgi:hypothetical protein